MAAKAAKVSKITKQPATKPQPAGLGRKRPQLNIEIGRLHLDLQNPRLSEEAQGAKEPETLHHLYTHFDLEEIAISMAQNGYFDEEPLVAVPDNLPKKLLPKLGQPLSDEYKDFLKTAEFTVVEGNRRLATARILLNEKIQAEFRIRDWPKLSSEVRDDLEKLPVIIYPERKEVLPYLGVRHIAGIKKWDSFAKARYIILMLKQNHSLAKIEHDVADRSQNVVKSAIAHNMLVQAEQEFGWDTRNAKEDFSYLLLALGQRSVKLFLGWEQPASKKGSVKPLSFHDVDLEEPVDSKHLSNMRDLLSWLYGEKTKIQSVIKESRDITNYFHHILASPTAVEYLRKTRDLHAAYEMTDGEEVMLKKLLTASNSKLEKALGIAHRHKTEAMQFEAEKCLETARQVVKSIRD